MAAVSAILVLLAVVLTLPGCGDDKAPSIPGPLTAEPPPVEEPPAELGRPPLEPLTHEHLASLKEEIARIEEICAQEPGTPRAEIEAKFGEGMPLHWTVSKLPRPEPPPVNSRRRGYILCEDGTLAVRYDTEWKVLRAGFLPPRGTSHGLPLCSPDRNEDLWVRILNAVLRLEQMKRIQAAYRDL